MNEAQYEILQACRKPALDLTIAEIEAIQELCRFLMVHNNKMTLWANRTTTLLQNVQGLLNEDTEV